MASFPRFPRARAPNSRQKPRPPPLLQRIESAATAAARLAEQSASASASPPEPPARGARGEHDEDVVLGRRRLCGRRGRGGGHGRGAAQAGVAQREGRAGDPPLRLAARVPRPRADPAPRTLLPLRLLDRVRNSGCFAALDLTGVPLSRCRVVSRRRRSTTSPTTASTTWWSRSTRWTSTARSSSSAPTSASACRRSVVPSQPTTYAKLNQN